MSVTFASRLTAVNLLKNAIALANAGRKDEARVLIEEACAANPGNDRVWLWRASLAKSANDAISWLERCLEINPENESARRWMEKLRPVAPVPAPKAEPEPEPEPEWACPFCSEEADQPRDRCSSCGGITVLQPSLFLKNQVIAERQLRHAVEHYSKLRDKDPDCDYFLALAQLNTFRSYDASVTLTNYLRQRPADETVRRALTELKARKLVLSVDDSPTVRLVVSDTLERAGYRTATACNGMDAVGFVLREATPDFILLDGSMPIMDGYEVCKTIKGLPNAKHVPIVMLSGNDGFVDKLKGRMAGADDYLIKPLNPSVLLKTIGKYLPKGETPHA